MVRGPLRRVDFVEPPILAGGGVLGVRDVAMVCELVKGMH